MAETKFEKGKKAMDAGSKLYEAKYGKKLIPLSLSKDYRGGDCQDDEQNIIDWKNNHDCYLFQYKRSNGYASNPNPHTLDCITDKIFVYDERRSTTEFYEYTINEYYSRYFKDISCIPELKRFLASMRGPCEEAEYFLRAQRVIQYVTPLIKDNITVARYFENHPDWDFKVILKIK